MSCLAPEDPVLLRLRHQLAHWTGESGDPQAAAELFERLLADRVTYQGPDHQDTELARHQLAHWHGRAGHPQEASGRYAELCRAAQEAGRTEVALDHLCNAAHWQQEGGDTAAALRTYTRMLRTAEEELGQTHPLAGIARQRYAELAGELPFGYDRGHDSLQDLLAAARKVEQAGDARRAGRMYALVADTSEYLYGAASEQALEAWVAQARTAVASGDAAEASEAFRQVLDCMELRGEGPGTVEYQTLDEQRETMAQLARQTVIRITQTAGLVMAQEVEAAPGTAFGVLAREHGGRTATHVRVLRDHSGGLGPQEAGPGQWSALFADLADRGFEPYALYFARDNRRPAPGEPHLCERLGLPGVYVSAERGNTVQMEGHAFHDGTPTDTWIALEPDARPPTESAATRIPGHRMALNPGAEAIGQWRDVRRARSARTADDPPAFGPYQVLEQIGEGGFGRVYLCRDPDGIMIAVKTLRAQYAADPDIRESFSHEVQAAQRVEGRFTVPVVGSDTAADVPWMAVPYVAAPSLRELAARAGPLTEPTVRVLGAGIAAALSAIHAEGIVHLDLKPANVLVTEDGPRVIDFGIAQIERLTAPREGFAGTYLYASPEQLREEEHLTPASDVFSLGTLLAHLALGRSPWGDGDAMSAIIRICTGEADLAGLPTGLEETVRRCLRLDPAQRPSPTEVAAQLLPGAGTEGPVEMPLPGEATKLIRDHATRAADHRGTDQTPDERLPAGPSAVPEDRRPASGDRAPAPKRHTLRDATRTIARDLGLRIQHWENSESDRDITQVRRECRGFLHEARSLLGALHPLTLRLDLSHALLSATDSDGVSHLARVLSEATIHLGEGHPAVADARSLLAAMAPLRHEAQ
jgi:serine/threonine protein kinase